MKFLLPLLLLTSPTTAYWRGFSIKSNLEDGNTCKAQSDWLSAFQRLKTFPNKINSVRVYSSNSCNTLSAAVPAAISTRTYILAGVLSNANTFAAEKGALKAAIEKYGWDWLMGVSVGSEDLYRGTISPAALAEQIYDVRGMLSAIPGYNSSLKVGHVDTTNAWTNASNVEVIRACDFVGTDIYPYFQTGQNNSIDNAKTLFDGGLQQVKNAVKKAGGNATVWVTETGWPINGQTKNLAVPGVSEARQYWEQVACEAFQEINTWWFTFQDWKAVPSFAVIDEDGEQLYSLSC